ncbi:MULTISPECIES: hypothetical protein [Reichenbachiella]|uniref:Long-chain fatty acid transport protein n=1 Tax=Reichenbachiella agariperforans TaxID=156994 RepID=A0A1M6TMQ2_REIAG|nr:MULTISPECIES: hypothetical protein [Reichenbachiella]RJE71434.1 hypothetical protein BGP76_04865 [Reichenbachiella sp. MSK19-1]SHK58231.1 hypothetical protein SAMN04488028_106106 [Reichenbachiella agariperforans]
MKIKNSIALVATCLCGYLAQAQITFSPYSVFGIGDIQSRAMSHQEAMGGVGIGTPSFYHINNMNPALLTYNVLSAFEIGLQGESRTAASEFDNQTTGTGGFKYLSFAFPVLYNRMTTNIGVRPYSSVNFDFLTSGQVIGNDDVISITENQGEGGISEVYWSNGIKIIDNLSVGVRSSFLFGFIEDETKIYLYSEDVLAQVPTGLKEKTNYKGFTFGFGASYEIDIAKDKRINIGATYDLAHSLEGDRLTRQVTFVNDNSIPGDTLTNRTYSNAFDLPAEYGIGVSFEHLNRFIIGIDVARAEWKEDAAFGDFSEQKMRDSYRAGLGVEIIPKYNDVDSYLSRVRYRFGVSYEQVPYLAGTTKIDDFGINFGWSLPVKSVSSLDMAFKYGQRGTKSDGLVKETYIKFVLGATLNDRWFVRRKYN